jgi:hypothetical protein
LSAEGVGVRERGDLDFGERGSSTVEARRRGKLLPSERKLADIDPLDWLGTLFISRFLYSSLLSLKHN